MPRPSERTEEGSTILLEMGKRLARERDTRRLSQRALSEASGIDMGTISRIEGGLISPSTLTVIALARALELPLDYLVLGPDRVRYREPSFSTIHGTGFASEPTEDEKVQAELRQLRAAIENLERRYPPEPHSSA